MKTTTIVAVLATLATIGCGGPGFEATTAPETPDVAGDTGSAGAASDAAVDAVAADPWASYRDEAGCAIVGVDFDQDGVPGSYGGTKSCLKEEAVYGRPQFYAPYVDGVTDCFDGDAQAVPGQKAWFSVPMEKVKEMCMPGKCVGMVPEMYSVIPPDLGDYHWDWNCDGKLEREPLTGCGPDCNLRCGEKCVAKCDGDSVAVEHVIRCH